MRTFPTIGAALLFAATMAGATVDRHRLLIVFAPTAASPALQAQQRDVASASAAFAERDLQVIEVVGDTVRGSAETAAALRARYTVDAGAFRALLVGKDRHVAIDSAGPIASARLVTTIDAMPMRRAEMRRP